MRQFDYSYLADRTWDNEIMSYISKFMSTRESRNCICVKNLLSLIDL